MVNKRRVRFLSDDVLAAVADKGGLAPSCCERAETTGHRASGTYRKIYDAGC